MIPAELSLPIPKPPVSTSMASKASCYHFMIIKILLKIEETEVSY